MRYLVWIPLVAFIVAFAYMYAREQRCQLCHREFGIWRRRYKGNGLWRWIRLCRKHRDEWDAKYSFKEVL
jgi:hypothetical protein